MQRVANPSRPWEGGGLLSAVPWPPTLSNGLLGGFSANLTWDATNKCYSAITGSANGPTMTSATAPSPFTVTGGVLNTTGDWHSPAWGMFSSSGRAYDGYDTSGANYGAARMALADGTFVNAKYVIIAGPRRTYTAYTIRSAWQTRQPVDWLLQGASSAEGPWTTVDARSAQGAALDNQQTGNYTIQSPGAYTHYRWLVTKGVATPGSSGYLDMAFMFFVGTYTALDYTLITLPVTVHVAPQKALFVARLKGGVISPGGTVLTWVSRDNGTTYVPVLMREASTLPNGSKIFAAEADFTGTPTGTQLVGKLVSTDSSIAVYGWSVNATA